MTKRFLLCWALGAACLVPLAARSGVTPESVLQGIGMGLVAAAVGACFLFAGKNRPDAGLHRAVGAVAAICALLWLGS